MRRLVVFGLLVLALLPGGPAAEPQSRARAKPPPPPPRFSFVALGCMPYGEENHPGYERLLAEIDRHAPAFVVHCGDTHGGSEEPSEARLRQIRGWFDRLDSAVIYTPGDNEWTDVHRTKHDPIEWLGRIRRTFFAEERSLGRRPIPLVTQRRDPEFVKFVENARWIRDRVVFATVHVVGSNNNRQPALPGAVAEFEERDRANEAWVRATFAEARAAAAAGVALFFQAQPLGVADRPDRPSGFTRFLSAVEEEAKAFGRPVLLVHADEHRYRMEPAVRLRREGEPLANVTRLETFGANDLHATIVVVDPASPHVFLAGPLIVPANALPVLPRKK